MKLTLHRKGSFGCWTDRDTHIENQCGKHGQTTPFLYDVSVTASHKSLDKQGFLVDNNAVHLWFDREFGFGREAPLEVLPSCERIAMLACDKLKELVRGCKLVVVKISGNGGDAWLTAEWEKS